MTDQQGTPSAPQTVLEYGPQPRWRHQRLIRASLILLTLGVITTGVWHRDYISSRASEMYWFSRCMNHVTPPGTKLVETDPTKAATLLKNNAEYFDVDLYIPPGITALRQVPITKQLWAEYIPRELQEVWKRVPVPFSPFDSAAVYVGRISTPSGRKRLLVLTGTQVRYPDPCYYIWPNLVEPPTLSRSAKLLGPGTRSMNSGGQSRDTWLKPALLDSNDPTHVIVPFDVYRGSISSDPTPEFSGIIDVYLRDDDTLALSERGKPNSTRIR